MKKRIIAVLSVLIAVLFICVVYLYLINNSPVVFEPALVSGYNYKMAIKNDGTLWGWGGNEYGQLGDGTTEDRHTPVKIMDSIMLPSLN